MTEVDVYQPRPAVQATPFTPVTVANGHAARGGDIDSWTLVVSDVIKLANVICETEFVPKRYRGNAPATAAAILAGRELDLPPMTALRHVQVVEGSPSLSAEYKRARVLAAGHEFDILEINTTRCRVAGRRRGSGKPPLEITFTMDDAKRAGLVKSRGAWETRPRRMLFARAGTELCDFLFADVTNGLPTAELVTGGASEDEFAGYDESPAQAAPANGTQTPSPKAQRAARRRTPANSDRPAPAPAASGTAPTGGPAAPDPALPPLPGEDEPGLPPSEMIPAGSESASADAPAPPKGKKGNGLTGVIHQHFRRLKFTDGDRDTRLKVTAKLAGVESITSTDDLDDDEKRAVADTLARCKNQDALGLLLAEMNRAGVDGPDGGDGG